MLRMDKVEWIWNYVKNTHGESDYNTLVNEKEEFLNEIIKEICEFEEWDFEKVIK